MAKSNSKKQNPNNSSSPDHKQSSQEKSNKAESQSKQKSNLSTSERAVQSLSKNLFDFPHGVLPLKMKYPVNLQKGGTFIFVLFLMSYYNNYSLGSYVYLALHGTYGWIWLLKDAAFPDSSFENKVGIITTLSTVVLLSAYWAIGWIQISGQGLNNPSGERVMFSVMLMALGSIIMMVADAQKTFTLKVKKGLINDGMFKYTRNPNYLGEMMVYGSFALITGNNTSWMILITVWGVLFSLRMANKDISIRQKEGGKEYLAQSSILLPKIFFKNTLLHYLSWAAIAGGIYYIYQLGGIQRILINTKRRY